MGKADIFGINEPKLDLMILEIAETMNRISNKFNNIETLIHDTKTYFVCESGNLFRNSFSNNKDNFQAINRNILSYSGDLVKVKKRFQMVTSETTTQVLQAKSEILSNSVDKYVTKN